MIRRAHIGDRAALEHIYDVCFPGEQSFREWIFIHVWTPENTLVYQLDGKIQSMLFDLPVELSINGENLPAHYIYAAGTLPEARGKKLMSALLQQAFADGAARGQHFSTLITGNDSLFDFYRPFGYQTVSAVRRFSHFAQPLDAHSTVRPANSGDLDELVSIYREETGQTMAFSRSRKHFEHMLDLYGDNLLVLLDISGNVKAYAFIEKWKDSPFVSEILGEKKLALAGALCNQMGSGAVFQDVATRFPASDARRLGCVRALSELGESALKNLKNPPYFNIMYN